MSNFSNEQTFKFMMQMFKAYDGVQRKAARENGKQEPVVYWDNLENLTKAVCGLAPLPTPPSK